MQEWKHHSGQFVIHGRHLPVLSLQVWASVCYSVVDIPSREFIDITSYEWTDASARIYTTLYSMRDMPTPSNPFLQTLQVPDKYYDWYWSTIPESGHGAAPHFIPWTMHWAGGSRWGNNSRVLAMYTKACNFASGDGWTSNCLPSMFMGGYNSSQPLDASERRRSSSVGHRRQPSHYNIVLGGDALVVHTSYGSGNWA